MKDTSATSFRIAGEEWFDEVRLSVRQLNLLTSKAEDDSMELEPHAEADNEEEKLSILQLLRRFQRLTDNLFHGKLLQFEQKYNSLKQCLESEHLLVSSTLLSLDAKRMYIMEKEDFMRTRADQLKEFEELRQYANPENLRSTSTFEERLNTIETNGHKVSEAVIQLQTDIVVLANKYNTAMNSVCALLQRWEKETRERS
eukprot:GHVO01050470.1.p1 GENE.GHVO01050470.1~~GHVO01050470.1.p1  ORF type:complete len:215 (+),score=32.74 GHVO01050470.1:46-645(+)